LQTLPEQESDTAFSNPKSQIRNPKLTMRFICGNCGGKATVPPGYAKAKIRCEHCGYYAEVPPEMRAVAGAEPEPETPFDEPRRPAIRSRGIPEIEDDPAPAVAKRAPAKPLTAKPQRDPRDHRPEFEEQIGVGVPLLEGDEIEHDGELATPYAVPGIGLKSCPECRGELPLDATFCVHCGWELVGERKLKSQREFTEIDETFHEGWAPAFRLQVFIALQFVNVLLMILGMVATGQKFNDITNLGTNVVMNLFNVGLQAFILGSFETLRITRDPKGRCTLLKTRRYLFVPIAPFKIAWKRSSGVGIMATHNPGVMAYLIGLYLLMMGCLPGILFYLFVLRPERFNAALCNEYGGSDEVILHCRNREQAEQVTRTIAEASGLRWHNIL